MIIFKSINKLNKEVNFKANIGFVPTMGSLHNGHISLIKSSIKNCDKTLVSIFINPSQFNKKSDLKNYPRNLKKDIKILKKINIDYLLIPSIKEIYKSNKDRKIKLNKEVNFKANVGFVPTMGSLHHGHISLIKSSKKNCKKTLVSIFVNPSQFNKKSDLQNYPKNLKKDILILKNRK